MIHPYIFSFISSSECSPSSSDPEDDEELIVEAPNGLRLIELQNKLHGEVCKHWEFLDACPPTRFCLDRDDIIKQEAIILVEDDLGNIHRSGPFYEFDKFPANDGDDILDADKTDSELSLKDEGSTKLESDSTEGKVGNKLQNATEIDS
jgi:hypothetical protein